MSLAISRLIFAQDCPSGMGVLAFTTQAEIDQFIIDYPNCKNLQSQLVINKDFNAVITDYSPFNNLESVRGLSLVEIDDSINNGFLNLKNISGQGLEILLTKLTNLDFLSGVKLSSAVQNVNIDIEQNQLLEDISGLSSIISDSIYILRIGENPLLSICHYSFICEILTRPPPPFGSHQVRFNAEGCDSIDEVLEQCDDPILPPDDPADPTLCPLASRPGMQINKVGDELYDVTYSYGSAREEINNVDYFTLSELILYHKVQKELLFEFSTFRLEDYCEKTVPILNGEKYNYDLPLDPLTEYNENRVMNEIDYFSNFILLMKENECLKI